MPNGKITVKELINMLEEYDENQEVEFACYNVSEENDFARSAYDLKYIKPVNFNDNDHSTPVLILNEMNCDDDSVQRHLSDIISSTTSRY